MALRASFLLLCAVALPLLAAAQGGAKKPSSNLDAPPIVITSADARFSGNRSSGRCPEHQL